MARLAVSLTTFVDFAASTGAAKATQIQKAKRQYASGYPASFDYWLTLRNSIISLHATGGDPNKLDRVFTGLQENKVANYTACVKGYVRWLRRHHLESISRQRAVRAWTSGDLAVRVNPELLVKLNAVPYAIKLYFSAPHLSSTRLDLSLDLIRRTAGIGFTAAVLDVRRSKLYIAKRTIPGMDALLAGEALLFVAMWDAISA